MVRAREVNTPHGEVKKQNHDEESERALHPRKYMALHSRRTLPIVGRLGEAVREGHY